MTKAQEPRDGPTQRLMPPLGPRGGALYGSPCYLRFSGGGGTGEELSRACLGRVNVALAWLQLTNQLPGPMLLAQKHRASPSAGSSQALLRAEPQPKLQTHILSGLLFEFKSS